MEGIASNKRRMSSVVCVGLLSLSCGCSLMKPSVGTDPRAEMTAGTGQPAAPVAKYTVELHPSKGQPERVEQTLSGPVTVQQALNETKALSKFNRSHVELLRQLPNGRGHRLLIDHDRAKKLVAPEFDYALQPGDRLILKEDDTTVMDDMLAGTLGSYSPKKPTSGRTKSGGFFRVGE